MQRPDFQLEIELDDASDRSHIRNALRENQFHHSRTDLSWSFEVSRNLGCIAVSISATLFGAALDYRSDLGDALAQVTSVSQFVVVNVRRGGSRGCAGAKPTASADDYHLVDKHRPDGWKTNSSSKVTVVFSALLIVHISQSK